MTGFLTYFLKMFFKLELYELLISGTLFFILSFVGMNRFLLWMKEGVKRLNKILENTSIEVILGGAAGLILGGIVGILSSFPFSLFKGIGNYITLFVFLLSGYTGFKIGSRRAHDVIKLFYPSGDIKQKTLNNKMFKILDTSAIIDGRIYDVCLTNFVDGTLLVPTFVIAELQHIADSSDAVRRNKGRRGLDLLAKMQKHEKIKIDIIETDFEEEKDVDTRLIQLCKRLDAAIITNDYNLNKVAELQGIKVLNINELANAVKLIVYPGESMHITVIKEGKEEGQGVGYLEDGTMVVVEDAQYDIGHELEVVVTSVFQTAAGRMIFTRKMKEDSLSEGLDYVIGETEEVNLYG
ncbi:MAG: TRAM domain-containing protein [Thermosyntropha sp.]|nr:TRAM domain-containing protein [Thermosyntropha sp.]